jgi:type IV secretory pathway VirB4 component
LLAEIAKTSDRIVLIEDTRELQCAAPNLVSLRTKDAVASLSDLVRSSLRLRPDRIPIGEVRGAEALDLLKAWGTGHPGAESWLYEGRSLEGAPSAVLAGFIDRTDRLLQLIDGFAPEAEWLSDRETLTYLHSCVSTKRHKVRVPETPMHLDAILADETLTGGLEPRLGGKHLRILTIMGFPSATHPGIFDELNRLAFPYRWSTRAITLDKTDATKVVTGLAVLLQSNPLKRALKPFSLGGPHGRLLDSDAEVLGAADIQCFETEGLIGSAAAPAVLSYLFHRIEGRLGGAPALLVIDEGWLALDDPGFAAQLREWLKTLRKKNASVVFATQSLADIEASPIAPAIVESCPTRIFLPNERAIEPQILSIYRRFGLNDRQIEIIARATPKRDYYCQSRRGNRLFELGLGPVALALCAASSKTDQKLISEVSAAAGREGFGRAWLSARGLDWAAELLPTPTDLETSS